MNEQTRSAFKDEQTQGRDRTKQGFGGRIRELRHLVLRVVEPFARLPLFTGVKAGREGHLLEGAVVVLEAGAVTVNTQALEQRW